MSRTGWRRYVPVSARRANAAREVAQMKKAGQRIDPVRVEGRKIARSFWGKAWCENLERYSDYANRMPRGRTYVRNGSVVDLQLIAGEVSALVAGSELYQVHATVAPLPEATWRALREDCAGDVGSVLELLRGELSSSVMERVCRKGGGLFPSPKELQMSCTCPDWAKMCKHVAAAMYGVGARLDERPELLFLLRGVDPSELVAEELDLGGAGPGEGRLLEGEDLAGLFGLEMDEEESPPVALAVAPPVAPSKTAEELKAIAKVEARVRALRASGGDARVIEAMVGWLERARG